MKPWHRDFFRAIPFQWVFHVGAFGPEERDEIIFRRNAEVLVPHRLKLPPTLRFIACRSVAERQTMLHLLPEQERQRWDKLIRIDSQALYERKWMYVEELITISDTRRVIIRLNPGATAKGPFHVRFEYREQGSPEPILRERDFEELSSTLQVDLPDAESGEATLWLDDSLAFQGDINFGNLS